MTDVSRHRARLAAQNRILDIVEQTDADEPLGSAGSWYYLEPADLMYAPAEDRRRAALAWLAAHVKIVQQVARELGIDPKLRKLHDPNYGVSVSGMVDGTFVGLAATVPGATVCEMVDTGEVDHIEAKDVPIMEKVCPPSVFAGIETEVPA